MKYYLMNKDNIIGDFELKHVATASSAVNATFYGTLPPGLTSLNKWLQGRQAAKHRQHIKELMEQCGCDTIEGFIRVIHCTSINDTLWVKAEDESVKWKDVSLYSNEFDEVIAKLAFEGVGLYGQQFSSTTPEFGTQGAYSKCITKDYAGKLIMYKRGTEGFANAGLEPYCEALSSELYSIITENRSVHYDLTKLHGRVASKCDIFSNERVGFVPYGSITDIPDLVAVDYYAEFGSSDLFRAMIVADAVCFNVDRHAGNHGMLYDNDTMELIKMAPVYDNNLSLLPYAMKSDFEDIDKYIESVGPRIGTDWIEAAKGMLTPHLRSILINLKGYEFKYDGCEKFPKERVKKLEWLVNRQIDRILN